MNVCTIIAKNYLAYARVLARSFAEHDPDARFWTLVIDDFAGYIDPAAEAFDVLTPADIGCEPFVHMSMRYSVLELSTAVKPWLLRHLMAETGRPVTYLDPDIKIYGSLARLDELAGEHGVVLIPHNTEPVPADRRKPSQVDIMISGVYNLGYVSLAPRAEVERLLDWWADRLVRDCRVDPVWGYFVDQRWFDLTPGFLSDLAIVRDPEYNVAYWNLPARKLEHDGTRYLVDGRPLGFFHFSGFDPGRPRVLSRYQNRIDVLAHPVLERVLAEYAADVTAAGHDVSREWPYSYGALGDGTRIDATLRALYDEFVDEHNGAVASPFTLAGARRFSEWLRAPAPGVPGSVNRALAGVYRDRPDLRGTFPDLSGPGAEGLVQWAREYGAREIPVLAKLMSEANGKASPAAATAAGHAMFSTTSPDDTEPSLEGPWGVNIVGHARGESGLGGVARRIVAALDEVSVPSLPIHRQSDDWTDAESVEAVTPEDAVFAITLLCLDPGIVPDFTRHLGAEFFAGRYSINLWLSDVTSLSDRCAEVFSLADELWAPTAYVASALQQAAGLPVTVTPIPVEPSAGDAGPIADPVAAEGGFVFRLAVDCLDSIERQNPTAVVQAFRRAFAGGDGGGGGGGGARLVLDCLNGRHDARSLEQLRGAAAEHPDITVVEADGAQHPAAQCDCYVSLHRAEPVGLAMAAAMWCGKPVIATSYSGNMDFMTRQNSLLVDHRLVGAGTSATGVSGTGQWADPDVAHAAALMRSVFEDRDLARSVGALAAADVRRSHSRAAAGETMLRRLEVIRATGRPRSRPHRVGEMPPELARMALSLRQGPPPMPGGRSNPLRALARSAVLRGMRPYTVYQQRVNSELLSALQEVHREIVQLRRATISERARLLSAVRKYERRRQD